MFTALNSIAMCQSKLSKYSTLLTIIFSIVCIGCKRESDIDKEQRLVKQELENISFITKNVVGTWVIKTISISAIENNYYQLQAGIKKDTVITNQADLKILFCNNDREERYPLCYCELNNNNKIIPLQFRLLSNANRVVKNAGPYASFLLETAHNYNLVSQEDKFLRNIFFISETYSLDQIDSKQMKWKGLNYATRGMNEVTFERK